MSKRSGLRLRNVCTAALTIGVLAVAAGCSTSNGDAKGDTTGSGSSTTLPAAGVSADKVKRDTAIAAGKAAAIAAGTRVPMAKHTIGVIEILGSAGIVVAEVNAIKESAKLLGWKVIACDTQAQAARFPVCADSVLTQGAEAVISLNVPSSAMHAQMSKARAEGIPWYNVGGKEAPDPLYTGQVVEDETATSGVLNKWMLDKMGGKGTIGNTTVPQIAAQVERFAQLKKDVAAAPEASIVSSHAVDLANQAQDVRKWALATLASNPKLGAFWGTNDVDLPVIAQAVSSVRGGKQYPDRPLVVGFSATLPSLDAIRKGTADAVVDNPLAGAAYVAMDQFAEFFARKTAPQESPLSSYKLTFLTPQIVSKKNVPQDPNSFPEPLVDFTSFFTAKWADEFKVN